ncbi:hypothetical protein AB3662_23760 [Sorangium cellulosum]|uniref:hypothetical protein n=1 Tax=Sorangium cellulosum TaxID=56 RepID=UPI003D9A5793
MNVVSSPAFVTYRLRPIASRSTTVVCPSASTSSRISPYPLYRVIRVPASGSRTLVRRPRTS